MSAQMWTVISNGRPVGDFAERQLQQWASEGRVNPADLVWRPGMTAAAPVHTLAPFTGYFATRPGDSSTIRWLLPVGRSPWAIAAGYLGLFSLLLVFGPFALVTGMLALRQIKRNPRLHGKGRAWFGIIAGGLATALLCCVIGFNV